MDFNQNTQPEEQNGQEQPQNQVPYSDPAGPQNQNQIPYDNQPYQSPYGNNGNYGNGYPQFPDNGYRQIVYPVRPAESGSSLANAAMILGIIALICCFTFTVYPAFVLGSIAILLALLSKGRRPALFPKAKTGIICATIGLVLNTILVTSAMVMVFTDNDLRQEMNEIMETQYGMSFDEMINEITEGSN